jgi:hypothetical protein
VVDLKRTDALLDRGDFGERHYASVRSAEVQHRHRIRIVLKLRRDLHDDLIFVIWRVNRRDLPWTIRRAQGAFDLIDGQPERRNPVAIEGDVQLRIRDLQVAGHIRQAG